jgi:hypothetical protein
MNARKVAARFAAYTCYEQTVGKESPQEAARFAEENWEDFLPEAPEGLGRLLLRIACGPRRRQRIRQQPIKRLLRTA